jgi:hypothetical protein
MRRVIPITEQFQHFVEEARGGLWHDIHAKTRQYWSQALELESARLRDVYMRCDSYERDLERQDYRNGFYERSFETRLGELRRVADAFTFFHECYRCAEHRIDLTAKHKKRRGAAFF